MLPLFANNRHSFSLVTLRSFDVFRQFSQFNDFAAYYDKWFVDKLIIRSLKTIAVVSVCNHVVPDGCIV